MATPNINNKSQVNNVKLSDFKAGTKKSQMKSSASKSVFDSLDTNKDGVISQNELKGIVKGKVKNKDGKLVEKEYIKLKNLENGRSLVVDSNGKQWVRAKDGTILKDSYVKSGFKKPVNQKAANTPPKPATNSQKIAAANLGKAYKHAEAAFNKQLKDDGWAEDLADGISKLWNNDLFGGGTGNTASQVRKEMQAEKKRVLALQKAAKQSDSAFRTQFKKIYGVDYNQASVDAYNKNPNEANYKKAFGTKIESIQQRVSRYNQSQKIGGAVVKTGTKVAAGVAIGVATGGTGFVALGAAAAATTAASIAVEETDRANITGSYKDASGKTVKQKGVFKEGTDHKKIFKDAAWDGASVLAGGAVGKAAGTIIQGTGKMAVAGRAAMNVTGDVAMGAAQEYAETGQITATGVATNAVMSGVGGAVTSGVLTKGYKGVKKGFGNVADNISHKFSAKKTTMPKTMFDANGMPLAGGTGKGGSVGFFGKLKSSLGLGKSKIDPDIKAKLKNNYMNDIIESVESSEHRLVSRRVEDALNGKTLITDMPTGANIRDISRYVPDGEICAVGTGKNQKLYINDNGTPVELNISREKFEELFPPLGTATFYQPGHQVCTIQANMNSMLESAGGRVQLFSMFEQNGDDIIINLRGGKAPVRFSGGKPVNINLKEHGANIFGGDAQGLEMLQQALLVDRVRTAANTPDVVNVSDLSTKSLVKQANTQVNDFVSALPLLGKNPKGVFTKKQKLEMIEQQFEPGQDVMTFINGGHQRSIVNYDPSTRTVTYHDPHFSGVDEQMPLDDFVDYAEWTFLNKRPKSDSTVSGSRSLQEPDISTTQMTSVVSQQKTQVEPPGPAKQAETITPRDTSDFVSKTTVLTNTPSVITHTAEGKPIRATITQSNVVIIKNGKYIPIEIPKSGTSEAIRETSTGTFLIIKNDSGKVSIVTSETPDLPEIAPSPSKITTSKQMQPQLNTAPVAKKRVELSYNNNSTNVHTASNTVSTKPQSMPKPDALPIPDGFRENGKVLGKRSIIGPDNVVMYERNGAWKRLN